MPAQRRHGEQGFFLVELIVAIFIFSLVTTLALSSLITGLDSNKKAQSLKSVLNNLTIVLDTMSKNMAVGQYFNCREPDFSTRETLDCGFGEPNPEQHDTISFVSNYDLGTDGRANDIMTYRFVEGADGGFIERSIYLDGTPDEAGPLRMTAPEVNITAMEFYVFGSRTTSDNQFEDDTNQPKVLITVRGDAPAGPRSARTAFSVQTVVSQRTPDFE